MVDVLCQLALVCGCHELYASWMLLLTFGAQV